MQMIENLEHRLEMLQSELLLKNNQIEEQADTIKELHESAKELAGEKKKIEKSYKLLESNHKRMKKTKQEMARAHQLEINTLQHEHNEMVGETGGDKRTLRARRADSLAHQNLIDSVNHLRKAIKNMMGKKSIDNRLLVEKLNQIDKLNKEIKQKDKMICDLNAEIAAQKYEAQKYCAAKRAESSEHAYNAAKERRLKSKEDHERKKQRQKKEHNNRLNQANHSSNLKVKEKTAILNERAKHLREFGKKTKTKNDLHVRTGQFGDVSSELDDSMPLLSSVLGDVVEQSNDQEDIVQKYARRLKKKREEKCMSVAARVTPNKKKISHGQHTMSQYDDNDNTDASENSSNSPKLIRTISEVRRAIVPGWIAKFDDESKSYFFEHVATGTKSLQSPRDLEAMLKGTKKRKKRKTVKKSSEKKVSASKKNVAKKGNLKTTGLDSGDESPSEKLATVLFDTDDDKQHDPNQNSDISMYDDDGSSKKYAPDSELEDDFEESQLPTTQKLEDLIVRKEIERHEKKEKAEVERKEKEKQRIEIDMQIIDGINGNVDTDDDTMTE